LQRATAAAYQEIFTLLKRLPYAHLWRVWNFIPRINEIEHGLERYRQFNIDRQVAFAANGRAIAGNVPAATAVGTAAGNLTLYFIAGRSAPAAIENPRQTAAYHYPAEYGPRTPVFARASAVTCAGEDLLFISGTASIVGHRTLHENDVAAQTRELLANIDSLLAAANEITQRRKFARSDLAYKVYVRHSADFGSIKTEIERWLGAVPDAIYLKADICRSELLVEVEASAGHSTEIIGENSEHMRT
jgi:enamine deaminase RidA (YjgF/YER057c/UK114 family)